MALQRSPTIFEWLNLVFFVAGDCLKQIMALKERASKNRFCAPNKHQSVYHVGKKSVENYKCGERLPKNSENGGYLFARLNRM